MIKPFISLDGQIEKLTKQKSIIILDKNKAKKYLLDNNYYNFISSSKIKFSVGIENKRYRYKLSTFESWENYYELDCKLSQILMLNLLNFEKEINSRKAYYLSYIIENQSISNSDLNDIIQKVSSFYSVHDRDFTQLPRYCGDETWKYITRMTFGSLKHIIFWIAEKFPQYYNLIFLNHQELRITSKNKMVRIKKQLNEVINLRNNIFHFTPLSIYITYGKNSSNLLENNYRKKIFKFAYTINKRNSFDRELDTIFYASDKFVEIKNSQTNG